MADAQGAAGPTVPHSRGLSTLDHVYLTSVHDLGLLTAQDINSFQWLFNSKNRVFSSFYRGLDATMPCELYCFVDDFCPFYLEVLSGYFAVF